MTLLKTYRQLVIVTVVIYVFAVAAGVTVVVVRSRSDGYHYVSQRALPRNHQLKLEDLARPQNSGDVWRFLLPDRDLLVGAYLTESVDQGKPVYPGIVSRHELPMVHKGDGRSVELEINNQGVARNIEVTDLVTLSVETCKEKTEEGTSDETTSNGSSETDELKERAEIARKNAEARKKELEGSPDESEPPKVEQKIVLATDIEILSVRREGTKTFAVLEVYPHQKEVWKYLRCTLNIEPQGTKQKNK